MNWSWLTSPLGITVLVAVILVAAALIYWKREPIRRWLRQWKLEFKVGPVTFKQEKKPETPASTAPGVTFGTGNDFTGATIRDVAGRDIRRGSAAAASSGGKAPGVDFGRQGQFRDAEITDVAGRDIVED